MPEPDIMKKKGGDSMSVYTYEHPNFKYSGVWQAKDGALSSYWNQSVAEVGYSGSKIRVLAQSAANVVIFVDGCEQWRGVLSGDVELVGEAGNHILKIVAPEKSCLAFTGVELPEGQQLLPAVKKPHLLFIGDSITHAKPGFSYTTGENLDVDYEVKAYCGMSLTEGWGWYKVREGRVRPGMETMFYKLENPVETEELTDYDFQYARVPDAIVIFLGTNDYLDSPEDQAANHVPMFAETYDRFVTQLAQRYPNAKIFIFQALSDKHCRREGILAAYTKMAAHLPQVELIPTDTWNAEISADGTHPAPAGYATLAEKMTEYLKAKMNWQAR